MKYSIGKISSLLNAGLDKNPVAKTEVGGYIKISYTGWGTHGISSIVLIL